MTVDEIRNEINDLEERQSELQDAIADKQGEIRDYEMAFAIFADGADTGMETPEDELNDLESELVDVEDELGTLQTELEEIEDGENLQ